MVGFLCVRVHVWYGFAMYLGDVATAFQLSMREPCGLGTVVNKIDCLKSDGGTL